jgi:hypothetical protein
LREATPTQTQIVEVAMYGKSAVLGLVLLFAGVPSAAIAGGNPLPGTTVGIAVERRGSQLVCTEIVPGNLILLNERIGWDFTVTFLNLGDVEFEAYLSNFRLLTGDVVDEFTLFDRPEELTTARRVPQDRSPVVLRGRARGLPNGPTQHLKYDIVVRAEGMEFVLDPELVVERDP